MPFHFNGYTNMHDLNLDWVTSEIKHIDDVKESVDQSETNAAASAEAAQASAEASQASAEASQQSAEASQLSAEASQDSAEASAASELSAKNYADNIADPVSGLVTSWLDNHVTPTTPVVDDTLTISGAAADAKITGDNIRQIENQLMVDTVIEIDKKPNLTTVGNGYYNNPLVMGLQEWRASAQTITYSFPVSEGERYRIKGYNYYGCHLVYFRGTDTHTSDFVIPVETNTATMQEQTFTIPYDGTLYIGTEVAALHRLELYQVTNQWIAKPYKIDDLSGKNWYCLGDSITYNSPSYREIISEKTGVNAINGGVTGTGYMKNNTGETDNFYTRTLNISTVYDIFTIFGSVNDQNFITDELIGTKDDRTTNTYMGCVNATIDNIYASGNNHLGVISPIPWNSNGGNPAYNLSGRKMANALKEICEYRGIPYLDLFRCSNMRPWESDFRTAYIPDGTHPNADGYTLFANQIEQFIRKL